MIFIESIPEMFGLPHRKWSAEEDTTARVLQSKGLSTREIGLILGYSRNAVIGRLNRAPLAPPVKSRPAGNKRSPKPRAEMTPREIEMVAFRERGETLAQISIRYGVTPERVRQILNRWGKRSLKTIAHEKRKQETRERNTKTCANCGTVFVAKSRVVTTCGHKCSRRLRAKHTDAEERAIVAKAIEVRTNGGTWREVGEAIGEAETWRAFNCVIRYARRQGIDLTTCLGNISDYYNGHGP